jgi:hypothetical protein
MLEPRDLKGGISYVVRTVGMLSVTLVSLGIANMPLKLSPADMAVLVDYCSKFALVTAMIGVIFGIIAIYKLKLQAK